MSGLHSKEVSKDVLEREEDIKVKRMYGLGKAFRTGRFDLVGSFVDKEQEMKPHNKMMIPIPEFIDETIKIRSVTKCQIEDSTEDTEENY